MLQYLSYDLLSIILSFCEMSDVCELICVSKQIKISQMPITKISVSGLNVYDFTKWLQKYNITRIDTLEISDYRFENDHCLLNWQENCRCKEEITDILQSLRIKSLILRAVDIDKIKWLLDIKSLSIINYTHDCDLKWVSELQNLEELSIMTEYNQYQVSYSPNTEFMDIGILNSKLKSFKTNMFYFLDDLKLLLKKSIRNENLRLFSFEMFDDTSEEDVLKLVNDIYPFTKIKQTKVWLI